MSMVIEYFCFHSLFVTLSLPQTSTVGHGRAQEFPGIVALFHKSFSESKPVPPILRYVESLFFAFYNPQPLQRLRHVLATAHVLLFVPAAHFGKFVVTKKGCV